MSEVAALIFTHHIPRLQIVVAVYLLAAFIIGIILLTGKRYMRRKAVLLQVYQFSLQYLPSYFVHMRVGRVK